MPRLLARARICSDRTMLKVSCAEDTRESGGYCAGRGRRDGRSDGRGPGCECERDRSRHGVRTLADRACGQHDWSGVMLGRVGRPGTGGRVERRPDETGTGRVARHRAGRRAEPERQLQLPQRRRRNDPEGRRHLRDAGKSGVWRRYERAAGGRRSSRVQLRRGWSGLPGPRHRHGPPGPAPGAVIPEKRRVLVRT